MPDRLAHDAILSTEFFEEAMQTMTLTLTPLVSFVAGILILIMPRMLSMIVAVYLIAVGLIGLFGMNEIVF